MLILKHYQFSSRYFMQFTNLKKKKNILKFTGLFTINIILHTAISFLKMNSIEDRDASPIPR